MDSIYDHADNTYSEKDYEEREKRDEMAKDSKDERDEEIRQEAWRLSAHQD